MHKRLRIMLSLMLCLSVLACAAAYAAGDASDPLISLSYITGTFVPSVLGEAEIEAGKAVQKALPPALERLEAAAARGAAIPSLPIVSGDGVIVDDEFVAAVNKEIARRGGGSAGSSDSGVSVLSLRAGERLRVAPGSAFTLLSGSAKLDGARSAEFVDVSTAGGGYAGIPVSQHDLYVLANDRIAGLYQQSPGEVLVRGSCQVVPVYQVSHTDTAEFLAYLGLFRGTGSGFSLEREATRLEGLIMFLRLLGEEEAALAYEGSHPFSDVPYWADRVADRYVAYAYAKGYAAGVGNGKFGASDPVTFEQYMTFLLRALGYSSETDFNWADAPAAAEQYGAVTAAEREHFLRTGFYRDGVAYISFRALFAQMKGSEQTLLDRLYAAGAITDAQREAALYASPALITR